MKFWLALGASVVNRSTSMSPFSVAIVTLVMAPPGVGWMDYGTTMSFVISIGWLGFSASAAAAIASATSMPFVTEPRIWEVLASASEDRASSDRAMKNCEAA